MTFSNKITMDKRKKKWCYSLNDDSNIIWGRIYEKEDREILVKYHTSENKKKENITEARKLDLKLNIGDSVIIMKGSFSNREGKIISLDEEKEIVGVEVNFLGQKTTIILPIVNCQRK